MDTSLSERDQLVFTNSGLVYTIAKKIASRNGDRKGNVIELTDLQQWGWEGLIDAAEKFDTNKGYKFSTYATWRIRGTIQDGLRGLDHSTRSDRKLSKEVEDLFYQGLSHEQIKGMLKLDDSHYNGIWTSRQFNKPHSLDEEVDGSIQLHETIAQKEIDHIDRLTRDQEYLLLHKASKKLEERDKRIFQMIYYEERTMKATGEVLGITKSRVYQLVDILEEKLRIILHPFIENPVSNGKYYIRFLLDELTYLMNAREELIHEIFGEKFAPGSLLEELSGLKDRRYQLKSEKPNTVYEKPCFIFK